MTVPSDGLICSMYVLLWLVSQTFPSGPRTMPPGVVFGSECSVYSVMEMLPSVLIVISP